MISTLALDIITNKYQLVFQRTKSTELTPQTIVWFQDLKARHLLADAFARGNVPSRLVLAVAPRGKAPTAHLDF